MGAGLYRVDERSGSMHGKKFLVSEVHFGSDGENLFVRVDFHPGTTPELAGMEARGLLQSIDNAPPQHVTIRLAPGADSCEAAVDAPSGAFSSCAFRSPPRGAGNAAAACVSSSRYGMAACRSTPYRSRAGSKWLLPTQSRWPGKSPIKARRSGVGSQDVRDSRAVAVLDCKSYGNSECKAFPALLPDLQR